MKAVILAGGGGTRLWPVSRNRQPKQVLPLLGGKTLLQRTFDRIRPAFPLRDILIVTNEAHVPSIRKQLPSVPIRHIIREPVQRDTAAAIGLAAFSIARRNPRETLVTINADQFVANESDYRRALKRARRVVDRFPQSTILVGVNPTYPETGLGYIAMGKRRATVDGQDVFEVKRFIEKPSLRRAEQFVRRWEYLWNPAMFVWRVDALLTLFRKHLPRHAAILSRIAPSLGTSRERSVMRRLFHRIPKISIDYGIIEKTRRMLVIPADFGWQDVGHWRTVHDVLRFPKGSGNVIRGRHIGHDTLNSFIVGAAGRLVATVGLRDMIVIDTPDAVLICPRDRAQDVKKLVERIAVERLKAFL